MATSGRQALRLLLFATAMLAAGLPTVTDRGTLDQSPLWLPSGVAVAGLVLLGARACWLVALTTMIVRLWIGYDLVLAIPAALGSAAEALVGWWLLQRLQVQRQVQHQEAAALSSSLGIVAAAPPAVEPK